MSEEPASVAAWREQGRIVEVERHQVFVLDTGPKGEGTPLLIFHGFPTSSHDWHLALPLLAAPRRVVPFDFLGYGLSDKPPKYSYSLFEQADLALAVCRSVGLESCHLLAHDMGTSVACEWMARRERGLLPVDVRSLTLSNGSAHIELAKLTPSQRVLRSPLGPLFARNARFGTFRWQLRRILGKPVADEELEAMWFLMTRADGRHRMVQIMSYIAERFRFWDRWIGALTRLHDLPVQVLWGTEDPVAVTAIADQLVAEIPDAVDVRLNGLGHYPQVEDPAAVADAMNSWLAPDEAASSPSGD